MAKRTSAEYQVALDELWANYKRKNCQKSREALVEHYRYLVAKTRTRIVPMVPVRICPEDLDTEGLMSLIRAVDQFDLDRKVKFESYAISKIRGAMLEYLRKEDWVPRSVRTKQKLLNRMEDELTLRNGAGNVTDEDRARYLELSQDAFYALYVEATVMQMISLDDAQSDSEHEESDTLAILDSVRSTNPDPYTQALLEDRKALLQKCIGWLPELERTVVRLYYYQGVTLKEISSRIGRSESRAHQLHSQAINRLSGFLARQQGLFFPEVLPAPDAMMTDPIGDAYDLEPVACR